MKIVAINGSPRKGGNTSQALGIIKDVFEKSGIEFEEINIGAKLIHGCIACNYCATSTDGCVFKEDEVNSIAQKIAAADGFILASPTYYGGIAGTMKSFLDRLFYSASDLFRHKAAASVAIVRRSGGEDVFHQLSNYLHLAEVLTPPTQYWAVVHGRKKAEMDGDLEGVQTLRRLAEGMVWVLRLLEAGKDKVPPPPTEERIFTSFIR